MNKRLTLGAEPLRLVSKRLCLHPKDYKAEPLFGGVASLLGASRSGSALGVSLTALLTTVSAPVHAHCPLCTAGAGAAAGAAALLGVTYGSIGVFLGGFAAALGLWISRMVKKRYIPWQKPLIFVVIYLSTLLPLIPFTRDYSSVFVSLFGEYGTLLNRTYLVNWFIVGALIGTAIVLSTPKLSAQLSAIRQGKTVKFQGLILTFILLIVPAIILQVVR